MDDLLGSGEEKANSEEEIMGGYLPTAKGVTAHTPDKRGRGATRMLSEKKITKTSAIGPKSGAKDTLSPDGDDDVGSPEQAYPNMLHKVKNEKPVRLDEATRLK